MWTRAGLPWRAGWRGRALGLHSPGAAFLGACWCQHTSGTAYDRALARFWTSYVGVPPHG